MKTHCRASWSLACSPAARRRSILSSSPRSPGGVIEHDLSRTEFEVQDEFLEADDDGGADAENLEPNEGAVGPMSPRRKWLVRQMDQTRAADAERVEEAVPSPLEGGGGRKAGGADANGWRGRAAMKRVRQKAAGLISSPLRRTMSGFKRPMDSPNPRIDQRTDGAATDGMVQQYRL